MSNNLDHIFKKALQDKSCEPPPYVWKNIEQHLNGNQRKIGAWWWRSAAAAAVIAAFLGIWLLHSVESPEITVANIIPLDTIKKDISETLPAILVESILERKESLDKRPTTIPHSAILIAKNKKSESVPVVFNQSQQSILLNNNPPVYPSRIEALRQDFIPLTSKEAFKNQKEYLKLLNDTQKPQSAEKKKISLTVSGHFTPTYSSGSYSSSLKNSRGANYSNNQMDGLMNMGGGVKLSVSASKRFSVQTGVFYSRMGQKTSESGSGVRAMMLPSLQYSDKMIATPLGNIKTRTKAVAYRSSQAIVLNSLNNNTSETIEQIFGTLEIPLHVRYLLNNNKVLFTVSGGISGNFIVNNKVYLKNGKDKEYIGSTEDIRNFNMSTDFGLGMEYPVTSKIKIMIEPGFKYYLQSLSENNDIDFKPYMFTFSTGIGIRF